MKKSAVFLAVVGSLVGVGIILSFYGNYVIFEDLVKGEGEVLPEQDLIIEVEIDSSEIETGIYAVQILENGSRAITASILDPSDTQIEYQSIDSDVYEGLFEVSTSGTYKLKIENSGEPVKIFGVIGPEPDSAKKLISFISLYILIMGLIGMLIVTVFIVINRKKESS